MKKKLYWFLIVLFAGIFLVSAGLIVNYMIQSYQHRKQMEYLQSLYNPNTDPFSTPVVPGTTQIPVVTTGNSFPTGPNHTDPTIPSSSVPPDTVATNPVESTGPTEPTKPPVTPSMQELYKINNDVVGWLRIADTPINYPVLQRKSDRDYYLNRDFYGKYSKHGSLYVREACDVFAPSDNVTIYGHNMADGSMFASILYFRDKAFFNYHKYIQFDTLTERHTYQVVCLFHTSGTYGEGFPFHLYDDFRDEAEYEEFITGIRELAIYDSGVETQYGDKFLCLSTCYRTGALPNGRLVLVAKRIS